MRQLNQRKQRYLSGSIAALICWAMGFNYILAGEKFSCTFDEIMLPKNVQNVVKTCMRDVRAAQITFTVEVPYKDGSILEKYKSHYTSRGWTLCRPSVEWHEFAKLGSEAVVRKWVDLGKRTTEDLLLVALEQSSRECTENNDDKVPTSQKVRIVLYDIPKDTFDKHINALDLRCE